MTDRTGHWLGPEWLRYIVNGLFATAVHYAVLTFNLQVLGVPSAGLSNLLAAVVGILVSFIGSRYWVFSPTGESFFRQATKFGGLYGSIALLHGLFLAVWSDWLGFDHRLGFVLATGFQVCISYLANKYLVFRQ